MSQWGRSRIIDGNTYLPLVRTTLFWGPIDNEKDKVEKVLLMDKQSDDAGKILEDLERTFLNRPYAKWLSEPFTSHEETVKFG